MDEEIAEITKLLVEQTKQIPACRELVRIPGIGHLITHNYTQGKRMKSEDETMSYVIVTLDQISHFIYFTNK